MKTIDLLERIINGEEKLSESGLKSYITLREYRRTIEREKKLFDLSDVWGDEESIKAIVEDFDALGIDHFTLSDNSTALMEAMANFQKYGFRIVGITQLKEKLWGIEEIINAVEFVR